MSRKYLHLLCAVAVIFIVGANNNLFVNGAEDASQSCASQCDLIRGFYSRFITSVQFLDGIRNSCVRKCIKETQPASAKSTTTRSTTTTTTTTGTPPRTTTRTTTPTPPRTTTRTTTTPTPPRTTTTTTPTHRPTTTTPTTIKSTTTTTTTTSTPPTTTTTSTTTTTTTTNRMPVVGLPDLGCGLQTQSRTRIVGGTDADNCEYPWVVAVTGERGLCGGSILDQRHILTAAHCVQHWYTRAVTNPSLVFVKVGSSLYVSLQTYAVLKVNPDPRYNPSTKDYDVAVLTLTTDLPISNCIAPVCLPNAYADPRDTDICVAAGWGAQQSWQPVRSEKLQAVELPIVNQAACTNAYSSLYINDLKFCAGDLNRGGIDACQGDSGGPLMCKVNGRYVVYGIVSAGRGCGGAWSPGIYTRVSHPSILNFISNATKDYYVQK